MTAWHGDPELKARIVARMHQHRKDDAFIQGAYQHLDVALPAGYRGCAIGCLLDQQPAAPRDQWGYCEECGEKGEHVCPEEPDGGWHAAVERQFGIPWDLADRIDKLFESADGHTAASDFAVSVVEAIPVGADLSDVVDTWLAWRRYREDRSFSAAIGKLFELIAAAPVAVSDVD